MKSEGERRYLIGFSQAACPLLLGEAQSLVYPKAVKQRGENG